MYYLSITRINNTKDVIDNLSQLFLVLVDSKDLAQVWKKLLFGVIKYLLLSKRRKQQKVPSTQIVRHNHRCSYWLYIGSSLWPKVVGRGNEYQHFEWKRMSGAWYVYQGSEVRAIDFHFGESELVVNIQVISKFAGHIEQFMQHNTLRMPLCEWVPR